VKTKGALLLFFLLLQFAWAEDLLASRDKCSARATLSAQVKCMQGQLLKMQDEIANLKSEREDLRRFVERLIDRRMREAMEPRVQPLTEMERELEEGARKAEEKRKAEEEALKEEAQQKAESPACKPGYQRSATGECMRLGDFGARGARPPITRERPNP
jgi:hypothetical protein